MLPPRRTSYCRHKGDNVRSVTIIVSVISTLIHEYRLDKRLKTKNEESSRLTDTGLVVELEHLKTKTRLIDKKFPSRRGE